MQKIGGNLLITYSDHVGSIVNKLLPYRTVYLDYLDYIHKCITESKNDVNIFYTLPHSHRCIHT
jgi:hypothetical protein